MNALPLTLLAPDRRRHGDEICDFVAKVFSGNGYYAFRRFCRRGYVLGSHYDWAASRIGLLDGRIVAHWGVWDYQMRIGAARVRAGGIGIVGTDGDLRKRGLMARTARASLAAMRALGYDLSILFGIEEFYHRFGYVRAWSDTTWTVRLADLPKERPTLRPKRFTPVRRDDISRLYNREYAAATGTVVKPTYGRGMYPRPSIGYLWSDARGRPAGYVIVFRKGAQIECIEACGDAGECLRVLAALGRRWGAQEIQFSTFSDAWPLIRRLSQGTCRAETRHVRSGGPMVATINLGRTLGHMAGELERRLRESPMTDWRGNLLVAGGRDSATLAIARSRVTVSSGGRGAAHAVRGGDHVAQLLIGADDPREIAEAGRMKVTGDAGRLLGVLFPAQHPQLSLRDRV